MKYKAITTLNDQSMASILILDTFTPGAGGDLKQKALDSMGIQKGANETYLDAYVRYLAEANGLPVTKPAHSDISELCVSVRAVARTVWLLA